jgi:hypothetical protein
VTVEDAEAAGELAIEGDRSELQRFAGLFPLPEPAAVPAQPAAAAVIRAAAG